MNKQDIKLNKIKQRRKPNKVCKECSCHRRKKRCPVCVDKFLTNIFKEHNIKGIYSRRF